MSRAEAHVHIGRARKGLDTCISLRELPKGHVVYAYFVVLNNVTFAVQPAGLRKFRESGIKNVHAFVRGETQYWDADTDNVYGDPFVWVNAGLDSTLPYREAVYNPVKYDTFVDKQTAAVVDSASEAVLIGKRVFYR